MPSPLMKITRKNVRRTSQTSPFASLNRLFQGIRVPLTGLCGHYVLNLTFRKPRQQTPPRAIELDLAA